MQNETLIDVFMLIVDQRFALVNFFFLGGGGRLHRLYARDKYHPRFKKSSPQLYICIRTRKKRRKFRLFAIKFRSLLPHVEFHTYVRYG